MKFGIALTVWVLAAAFIGGPVLAQDRDPDQQPGAPLRLVAPVPTPDRDEPAAPAGIDAAALGPLDPSWADALPKGDAALPTDMWQGTSRGIVRALLALLGPTESPALRALARRLLLSGAASPRGADPADGPSLVLLRAQALTRLGAVTGAKVVLDNFPADKRGEAADRLRIELAFAGNDLTDGCRLVAVGLTQNRNVWWDQANIACQLLSGARDKAALALDILHDRDATPDPLFDTLVAAATGHAARLDKHAALTPLRASLWAMSKRPLPAEAIAAMDAVTAAAFASGREPPSNRLAAAERAAALGAWPPERLAELYGKVNFSDAERDNALADDKAGDTAEGRAVLFDIAQKDADASRRGDALRRFLTAAERHDLFFVAAPLAAPIVVAIGPGDATKSGAPVFVRALLAADRAKDAAPWLILPDAASAAPLVTIARAIDGTRADDKAMDEALAALSLRSSDTTPRQIGLFLMLASEYGLTPSATELAAQMAPAHQVAMPSAAVWLDLRRAQAAHRLGETVLASLVLAQEGVRLTAEPIVLQRTLAALRAAGLDAEARAIAREAAVAGGL
jgi:hypothetical protein